jgi:hypothetical protein
VCDTDDQEDFEEQAASAGLRWVREPTAAGATSMAGAEWCIMVSYRGDGWSRQNCPSERVDSAGIARRVRTLARTRKTSANRVLVDLIVAGLQSKESEKGRVFLLVSRLTESSDRDERERLKEELARMTFGV